MKLKPAYVTKEWPRQTILISLAQLARMVILPKTGERCAENPDSIHNKTSTVKLMYDSTPLNIPERRQSKLLILSTNVDKNR